MRVVEDGSGAETYAIYKAQFKSVRCPTWEDRVADASQHKDRISVFNFGLDKGSDNVGALGRIRTYLSDIVTIMFCVVFCFAHGLHHIVEAQLAILDAWAWDTDDEAEKPSVKYWSGLATVANCWRSVGMPRKIAATCVRHVGDDAAAQRCFSKKPGRPIRGRWAQASTVEKFILAVCGYIGVVFRAVFEPKPRKVTTVKVGGSEQSEFQRLQGMWRSNAVQMTSCRLFIAMMHIAHIAKEPFDATLFWFQKRKKECAASREKCVGKGLTFFGETQLSMFATSKCRKVYWEICNRLSDSSADVLWKPVWAWVDEKYHPQAIELITSLVLCGAASWLHRMVGHCEGFPLLLLLMVDEPADAVDDRRRTIARQFIDTSLCCLKMLFDDFAWKTRQLFMHSFTVASESGPLSHRLVHASFNVARSSTYRYAEHRGTALDFETDGRKCTAPWGCGSEQHTQYKSWSGRVRGVLHLFARRHNRCPFVAR